MVVEIDLHDLNASPLEQTERFDNLWPQNYAILTIGKMNPEDHATMIIVVRFPEVLDSSAWTECFHFVHYTLP